MFSFGEPADLHQAQRISARIRPDLRGRRRLSRWHDRV